MASYEVKVRSDAAPRDVFALVADATTWSQWAGGFILHSSFDGEGDPPPGGVGAIRRLGTRWAGTRERITEYDPPHYLAYTILSRMPFRDYRAVVSLAPSSGGTLVTWGGSFEPRLRGTGRLIAWLLTRVVGKMARGLASYAARHADGQQG